MVSDAGRRMDRRYNTQMTLYTNDSNSGSNSTNSANGANGAKSWVVSTVLWCNTAGLNVTMALHDMLLGLAKDQQCNEIVYNFLTRGGGEVIPDTSLPTSSGPYNTGPSISWSTIFAFLKCWVSPALLSNPLPCLSAGLVRLLPRNKPLNILPSDPTVSPIESVQDGEGRTSTGK